MAEVGGAKVDSVETGSDIMIKITLILFTKYLQKHNTAPF